MSVTFEEVSGDLSELESLDGEAAVGALLATATSMQASDLFLLRGENHVLASVRHWGRMKVLARLPEEKGTQLMLSIKALAGMDISERRRPLDGRFMHHVDGRVVDLRVNSIPTLHGEDISLRILDRDAGLRSLDSLGMIRQDLAA